MAGASDKARFYLERTVPELREYERKGIFSKHEITSIVKKRSNFEHTLNARGSKVFDYVRYAEYEMNLDALRRKRTKRLGVRSSKSYEGQRRIFMILNRATEKFHGDVGLWRLYLDYTRRQKAHKKTAEVMTKMLRMHPTNPGVWIYAAKYAAEEKGDMMEARDALQRGLRFCERDQDLWIQYGKLEMMFIARIAKRRNILGLDQEERLAAQGDDKENGHDDDVVALPVISAEEFEDEDASRPRAKLSKDFKEDTILAGAMPLAVFDAGIKQFNFDAKFGTQFFDMIAEFEGLSCRLRLLNHVLDTLRSQNSKNSAVLIRYIKLPVLGIKVDNPAFPPGLGQSLSRLSEVGAQDFPAPTQADVYLQCLECLAQYLTDLSLDDDIRQVIVLTLPKIWQNFSMVASDKDLESRERFSSFQARLGEVGLEELSESCRLLAGKIWPDTGADPKGK